MESIKEVNVKTSDINTLKETSKRRFAKYQEPYVKETTWYTEEEFVRYTAEFVGFDTIRGNACADYYGLHSVVIHPPCSAVGYGAFKNCETLVSVKFPDTVTIFAEDAFAGCTSLTEIELPKNLKTMAGGDFVGCTGLSNIVIPESVETIMNVTFKNCTGLTTVTFKGTPDNINGDVFTGCTNLTTINVPWAEGAVANAPWGATNATINYNYTA